MAVSHLLDSLKPMGQPGPMNFEVLFLSRAMFDAFELVQDGTAYENLD